MSADYPAAQEHLVPRSFMFNSNAQKAVIIHKTGGDATPQAVYNTFINSGNPGKSSHYAIGQDGSIWQFVPESLGAGANGITDSTTDPFWYPYMKQYGNLNTCTISIEHCDPSRNNDTPLTPAQKQASFALVAHLCQKYGIPADHIKPHRSIVSTDCPGTYPMDELIAFVQQGGSMDTTPAGWHDDGTTLTDPNGVTVSLGFRTFIRANNWDPTDTLMRGEYHADSVLIHNAGPGAGQRLSTKKSLLWWTSALGVRREPYLGWELDAAYQLIAQQQAQIAALQAQLARQQAPAPVDTTALLAAINAIPDAIAQATATATAQAVVEAKKL